MNAGLLDLIDGGGFGRTGPKFEGGGLLSAIANLVATPYGSRERAQQQVQPTQASYSASPAPQRPQARPQAPSASQPPQQRPVTPVGAEPIEHLPGAGVIPAKAPVAAPVQPQTAQPVTPTQLFGERPTERVHQAWASTPQFFVNAVLDEMPNATPDVVRKAYEIFVQEQRAQGKYQGGR